MGSRPSHFPRSAAVPIGFLQKAWNAGFRDPQWARRDPDLAALHGHPDFERMYPAGDTSHGRWG
jgi:hypothetical protein